MIKRPRSSSGYEPPRHKDPWDRLLIGQALAEGAELATKDEAIRQYEVPVLW